MCDYVYISKERKGEICPYSNYGQVTLNSKKYCIFHAPIELKDEDEFWEAFSSIYKYPTEYPQEKKESFIDRITIPDSLLKRLRDFPFFPGRVHDFEGFIFPDTTNRFNDIEFMEKSEVNFRSSVFSDNADFKSIKFPFKVDFSGATFEGKAEFNNANFQVASRELIVAIKREDYFGYVFFNNVDFRNVSDFTETKFHGKAFFSEANFRNEAKFFRTIFNDEVDFRSANFFHKTGKADFNNTEFTNSSDFSGSTFYCELEYKPSKLHYEAKTNFFEANFFGDVDCSGVEFSGEVNFVGATFLRNVDFSGTRFLGGVDFEGAKFLVDGNSSEEIKTDEMNNKLCILDFNNAEFREYSDFSSAEVSRIVDFSNADFFCGVTFEISEFYGRIIFNSACFHEIANFRGAEFVSEKLENYDVNLNGAIFAKEADFGNAKFLCGVKFVSVEFCGPTNFNYAKLLGIVDFTDAKFMKELKFIGTNLKNVNFSSAIFNSQVNFNNANVGIMDFTGAVFHIRPYFGNLGAVNNKVKIEKFVGEAEIEFTRGYRGFTTKKRENGKIKVVKRKKEDKFSLYFDGVSLDGILNVHSPVKVLHITNASFRATINIYPSLVDSEPKFFANKVNFLGDTAIRNVKVKEIIDCNITRQFILRNADLRRASFRGTSDLRKIDFINVRWSKINRRLNGCIHSLRKLDGLYDELIQFDREPPDDHDFEENPVDAPKPIDCIPDEKERDKVLKNLSEMYRAVASSFESRQRYGSAGPFKVGEFDMRKWMMKDVSRLERIVLRAYRFISSYGESVVKPLVFILGLMFFSAFIYIFDGFPDPFSGEKEIINYNLLCPISPVKIVKSFFCLEDLVIFLYHIAKTLYYQLITIFDYIKAFFFSVYATISIGGIRLKELNGFCSFLPPIQRSFFVIFTAFFLFALRRKAKR